MPIEVQDMLDEHNKFAKIVEKMKGLNKGKGDAMSNLTRNPSQMASQLGSMIPQNLLNQMGGAGNLMNMMKEMGSMEGLAGLAGLGGKKTKKK